MSMAEWIVWQRGSQGMVSGHRVCETFLRKRRRFSKAIQRRTVFHSGMSAVEMQSLLARLYIDEYCRHLFFCKPDLVLAKYRLTEAEINALESLNADTLDSYAGILLEQREHRIRGWFPFLYAINDATEGRPIERFFRRFHSLHPAIAEAGPEVEVRSFAAFIRRSLAGTDEAPPYAGDIARYDAVRFRVGRKEPTDNATHSSALAGQVTLDDVFSRASHTSVETFEYDVASIAAQLRDHALPTDVEKQTTTIVLQRQNGKLKTLAVSGPTAMLLRRLDGLRTVQAVVESLEDAFGVPGLRDHIVEIIRQLEKKGIITRAHA